MACEHYWEIEASITLAVNDYPDGYKGVCQNCGEEALFPEQGEPIVLKPGKLETEKTPEPVETPEPALRKEVYKRKVTPEIEADVVKRYQAGEKIVPIRLSHDLGAGTIYRILRSHQVALRREEQKLQEKAQMPTLSKYIKAQPVRRLLGLVHDEVAGFRKAFEEAVAEYRRSSPDMTEESCREEAWLECHIDYQDALVDRLAIWIETIGEEAGGIILGLEAVKAVLMSIKADVKMLYPRQRERMKEERRRNGA